MIPQRIPVIKGELAVFIAPDLITRNEFNAIRRTLGRISFQDIDYLVIPHGWDVMFIPKRTYIEPGAYWGPGLEAKRFYDELSEMYVYCKCNEHGCNEISCKGRCGCKSCDMSYQDYLSSRMSD